jgi:hypothetical protein
MLDRLEYDALFIIPTRRYAGLVSLVDPNTIHRRIGETFGDRSSLSKRSNALEKI